MGWGGGIRWKSLSLIPGPMRGSARLPPAAGKVGCASAPLPEPAPGPLRRARHGAGGSRAGLRLTYFKKKKKNENKTVAGIAGAAEGAPPPLKHTCPARNRPTGQCAHCGPLCGAARRRSATVGYILAAAGCHGSGLAALRSRPGRAGGGQGRPWEAATCGGGRGDGAAARRRGRPPPRGTDRAGGTRVGGTGRGRLGPAPRQLVMR